MRFQFAFVGRQIDLVGQKKNYYQLITLIREINKENEL